MNSSASQKAAAELLRRRRARRSLAEFVNAIEVPGRPLTEDPDEWLFSPIETSQAAHHLLLNHHLHRLHSREIRQMMVFMPPGSAKSTYGSVVFPSFVMGSESGARVIMASYATPIAIKQSRRTRQIVRSELYRPIWNAGLVAGNESVEHWSLTNGSEYMAGGILSGMTGNRATHLIIDDPVKGREDADSETIRRKTREAYEDDLSTRLMPDSVTLIIQCMVGSTNVLMADGTQKLLKEICVGDRIATYSGGRLESSVVLNWANQGSDCTYKIRTNSGIIVEANERHPFLVERDGVQEWVRLRNLRIGDRLVRADPSGVSGEAPPAHSMDATNQPSAKGCACPTTTKQGGKAGIDHHPLTQNLAGRHTSNIDTESMQTNIAQCLSGKAVAAQFVGSLLAKMSGHTGVESSASITTTQQEKCAVCCATIATSQLDTAKQKMFCGEPLSTFGVTLDSIVEISESGYEDVYDIQVAETENFIANGLVSHNTRWHQDDLSGGILPVDWHGQSGVIRGRDGLDWFVLCLPAVAEHADDPLGRKIGDPLWPEWFKGEHFERFKANRRTWSALFQQVPTPDSGDYFTADMFRYYGQRPEHLRTYGASDFAVTEGSGDYTEHCIVGVDPAGRLFVLDWWSGQTTADVWIDSLLDMAEKWKTVKWFAESGVIRRAVEPFLRKAMQERRKYQSIEWIASIQDKPTRARSIQGRFAQGMVYLPESAEWRVRIERQFLAFPAGRNDDAVDTLGLIGRGLDMTQSAVEPAAKVRNELKPGSIEWTLARTRDEKKASPYRS